MNTTAEFLEWLNTIFNTQLFTLGGSAFTFRTFTILCISLFTLFFLTSRLSRFLIKKVFPRYNLNVGVSESIATIIRYLLIVIGLYIIFQSTGIDLSAIGLLLGALGVGIGFGLQNITSNFISGIIILFERPIKVGDRVDVDGLTGNIINISARATTILTNDNIAVIVPNSDFINGRVVNWSLNDDKVRLNQEVGVSYKENPDIVRERLIELIRKQSGVLKTPEPYIRFDGFGESSLDFTLQYWTTEYIKKPMVLKSDIYYEIFRMFKANNIEIPFPQRDVYIRSMQTTPNDPENSES
jgi:small-conductance mechanosensitive channel